MRAFLVVTALSFLTACPPQSQPECTRGSDCAPREQSTCASCPPTDTKYCEGQKCVDKGADDRTVSVDLTTPRNVAVRSVRWAAITFKSTREIASCAGGAGCTADAVTCETVTSEGLGGPSQNIAATGMTNTDTSGGSVTFFQGVQFGNLTHESLILWVEGRSETLGNGETLAKQCRVISADDTTASVTLVAN